MSPDGKARTALVDEGLGRHADGESLSHRLDDCYWPKAGIQAIYPASGKKEKIVVFLAITPVGLNDALRVAADSDTAVWCGADAISEEAYGRLGGKGLSRFIYDLRTRDPGALEEALDTIGQHHPGEVVWMEAAPTAD